MKRSLSVLLWLAALSVGCANALAVVRSGEEEGGGEGSPYAEGRIVVKLREEASARIRREWERWGELTPDRLPFESLRNVSERNGVARWEPLIPNVRGDDSSGLGRTYVLTLTGGGDVLRVVQDFSGLADLVEYAEPDFVAQIQTSEY